MKDSNRKQRQEAKMAPEAESEITTSEVLTPLKADLKREMEESLLFFEYAINHYKSVCRTYAKRLAAHGESEFPLHKYSLRICSRCVETFEYYMNPLHQKQLQDAIHIINPQVRPATSTGLRKHPALRR